MLPCSVPRIETESIVRFQESSGESKSKGISIWALMARKKVTSIGIQRSQMFTPKPCLLYEAT